MQLAQQQQEAFATVVAWLRIFAGSRSGTESPWFYLGGFAGTGKTTIAKRLAEQVNGKVKFAAYTGKAAKVMRAAGCSGAQTLHSLLYDPEEDSSGRLIGFIPTNRHLVDVAAIVIDECSMVDEQMAAELLSREIPVLVLGDPEQLPPVGGEGFFTRNKPHFMLTEVHRQAKDSPILRLATEIREGSFQREPHEEPGLRIVRRNDLDPVEIAAADTVIVGKNETRRKTNAFIRKRHGYEGPPVKGERLICLRNDRNLKISNGETFVIDRLLKPKGTEHGTLLRHKLKDPDDPKRRAVKTEVFEQWFENPGAVEDIPWNVRKGTQAFDYGYALTAHKSQGSQWPTVMVRDESACFGSDARRWLYTAVTRAANQLTLVI